MHLIKEVYTQSYIQIYIEMFIGLEDSLKKIKIALCPVQLHLFKCFIIDILITWMNIRSNKDNGIHVLVNPLGHLISHASHFHLHYTHQAVL